MGRKFMVVTESSKRSSLPAQTLLLHPDDTVLVCIAAIAAGDTLWIDGKAVAAPQNVAVGHKLARHLLEPGAKVTKHGAPIGSVTQAVAQGAHVHGHNMKSDYIPSHSRQTKQAPNQPAQNQTRKPSP